MAQNKPSVFRFRLPWLLAPPPATATETPRTTVQTSVASTSAPKPPFRPPGRAPPPTITTPRAPPQSSSSSVPVSSSSPVPVSSPPPPPPPAEVKLSAPKSPIAKTISSPVATRSTKETQTATAASPTGPTTPPHGSSSLKMKPLSPPQPSSPMKQDTQPVSPSHTHTPTNLQDSFPPPSPSRMPTPPPSPPPPPPDSKPSSPPEQNSQPSSPSPKGTKVQDSSPPLSPSRMPTPPPPPPPPVSKPLSPSSLSGEATHATTISQPTSPVVHIRTPPPPPPSPPVPTITTNTVEESLVNHGAQPTWSTSKPDDTTPGIKKSTQITHENFPQSADLATDAKPKETTQVKGAQTKSMNPRSMEENPSKPKHKIAARVPLHREIKDDISKFIHKMATNPPKQSMNEKDTSVITLAGDNKGAFMHLGSDANKRGYKPDGIINNGQGSSNRKKSQKASEDEETKAIVNSNVQGINNSIMFNSSVTERNPGVHLAFSRNTDSKMENTEAMEMYKAEVDITPPDTLVYDPTLGRSIGGFILELSDSEPNDLDRDCEINVV